MPLLGRADSHMPALVGHMPDNPGLSRAAHMSHVPDGITIIWGHKLIDNL